MYAIRIYFANGTSVAASSAVRMPADERSAPQIPCRIIVVRCTVAGSRASPYRRVRPTYLFEQSDLKLASE